jgi:hypothetical protein
VPDRVELLAHGSLILGRDDEAVVREARLLEGGEATYLVRYFRGGRQLHGNGVLGVEAPEGVTSTPRTSFLFENREWLTLDTTAPMTGMLDVYADEVRVGSVPLVVVPEGSIEDIVVLTQSEGGTRTATGWSRSRRRTTRTASGSSGSIICGMWMACRRSGTATCIATDSRQAGSRWCRRRAARTRMR